MPHTKEQANAEIEAALPYLTSVDRPSTRHMGQEEREAAIGQMLVDLWMLAKNDGCIAAAWAFEFVVGKFGITPQQIAGECFLLEDDPPEDHGKPIACTQCWNALSEMERLAASKVALLSPVVDEYQSLVDWLFSVEHPMPKERTTAHRIATEIEGVRRTSGRVYAGRVITTNDVAEVLRELVWSIRGNDGASPELMKAHEMLHNLGKTVACVPVAAAH